MTLALVPTMATVWLIAVSAIPSGGTPAVGPSPPPGSAAGTWHNVTFRQYGPPSQDGALAYDVHDRELVLFVSETLTVTGRVNYTWTFAARAWHNVTASVAPSPRAWPAMAYDPQLHAVLLFGGFDNGPYGGSGLGDTWEFANGSWTQLHPASSPSPRGGAGLVFDAALGRMLLFGGSPSFTAGSAASGTVWSFGPNRTWVQGPSGNLSGSLTWSGVAYDAARSDVVVFGGAPNAGCGCQTNTTWVLSGTTWRQAPTPGGLVPRLWTQMTFDPDLNATILFGGSFATSGTGFSGYNDTWAYGAHGWGQLNVSGPASRAYGYLAWNPPMTGVLLYGGLDSGRSNPYAMSFWVLR